MISAAQTEEAVSHIFIFEGEVEGEKENVEGIRLRKVAIKGNRREIPIYYVRRDFLGERFFSIFV